MQSHESQAPKKKLVASAVAKRHEKAPRAHRASEVPQTTPIRNGANAAGQQAEKSKIEVLLTPLERRQKKYALKIATLSAVHNGKHSFAQQRNSLPSQLANHFQSREVKTRS